MSATKLKDVTGALICGGKSTRFGSDKRLFQYQGKTLLETGFQKLSQICFETVCVFRDSPPVLLSRYPHIFDEGEVKGPMAGVLSALNSSQTPFVLCLACDVPLISERFLWFLCSHHTPHKIVVAYTKQLQPLIALYPVSFYQRLKLWSTKSHSLSQFILSLDLQEREFLDLKRLNDHGFQETEFLNVNYPEDLFFS